MLNRKRKIYNQIQEVLDQLIRYINFQGEQGKITVDDAVLDQLLDYFNQIAELVRQL